MVGGILNGVQNFNINNIDLFIAPYIPRAHRRLFCYYTILYRLYYYTGLIGLECSEEEPTFFPIF